MRTTRPLLCLVIAAGLGTAHAQSNSIYTCADASGKRITADRPIGNCAGEQRQLNPDGSTKRVVPPQPTEDERAAVEAKTRASDAERSARQVEARRDQNLVRRFQNEEAHNKARQSALDAALSAMRSLEARGLLLREEDKRLLAEGGFYVGKQLPTKLKGAMDANDAALEAQKALVQNQQAELTRINALYDLELARLRKLWNN